MDRVKLGGMKVAYCPKCSHPVREHQPCWGMTCSGNRASLYGCSICDCQMTEREKLKAWGGR